jgi:hypothetical protein
MAALVPVVMILAIDGLLILFTTVPKVVYASILLGFTVALFFTYRRRSTTRTRRDAGLCYRCAYDLVGLPPGACPECGAIDPVRAE